MNNNAPNPVQIQAGEPYKPSRLRVTIGRLTSPTTAPMEAGSMLADQCIQGLKDLDRFPPRLLVFIPTPAFDPYRPVLVGIRNRFVESKLLDIPLIGATAGACIFDGDVHEKGALLICVGSRLVSAKTAVAVDAQTNWKNSISKMLMNLDLGPGVDMNPRGNRFLYAFLPGLDQTRAPERVRAGEIMDELRKNTNARLPIFGGVASGGLGSGIGAQFEGDNVYSGAVVCSRIDSGVSYGISLAVGLGKTVDVLRVKEVTDSGHAITSFWEGDPNTVMNKLPQDTFFREWRAGGDFVVVQPKLKENRVLLRRPVTETSVLQVTQPDPGALYETGGQAVQNVLQRARLRRNRVMGLLAIGCIGRYRMYKSSRVDLRQAVSRVSEGFPTATFAGCYMEGEIGLDSSGRSVLGNQSVALALLADDIPNRYQAAIGFDVLSTYANRAEKANSLDTAMERILQSIREAHFPGGMISLVLRDFKRSWIVARKAVGDRWVREVLPLTQRALPGEDILAKVAEVGEPRFVCDSRIPEEGCDLKAINAGDILSQYIIPLLDATHRTIALLQVDLGDMRDSKDLEGEQRKTLNALGSMAANLLNRVMYTEELNISRRLDRALVDCLECDSQGSAAAMFLEAATHALGAEGHVRLRLPNSSSLRLVGGIGRYYEAAKKHRLIIDISDRSPSARSVRLGRPLLCNDAQNEEDAQTMRQRFGHTELGEALNRIRAFTNIPIALPGQEPTGLVNFCSDHKWFFTQSKLRSVKDIGERLGLLLNHIERKRSETQTSADTKFLLEIAPQVKRRQDLHSALRGQVERVKQAARAQVVCCYLWDEDRQRYILRAEAGWHDTRWVDAAWYEKGHGMTGNLATGLEPRYIPDLKAFKRETNEDTGKYINESFGAELADDQTCEVIALPLQFRGHSLGIMTLFRKTATPVNGLAPTGFATQNPTILKEAAESLSAYVCAMSEYEMSRLATIRSEQLAELDGDLLANERLKKKLNVAVKKIMAQNGSLSCSVYVSHGQNNTPLKRVATAGADIRSDLHQACQVKALSESKTQVQRRPATLNKRSPSEVKLDGALEYICLPVKFGKETVGLLDLVWSPTEARIQDVPETLLVRHLETLAARIAVCVASNRLRHDKAESQERALRSQRALDGMALILRASVHRLANEAQDVQAGVNLLVRPDLSQNAREIVESISKAGSALKRILDRARSVTERLAKPKKSLTEIDSLLREKIARFRTQAEKKEITIKWETPRVTIPADSSQVLEAFENVIENAIKAIPGQGRLDIVLREVPGYCEVIFSDTGKGMSDLTRQRILGLVEYQNGTVERIGLGLFLARLYCESHGGGLDIQSSLNQGTTVTLRFASSQEDDSL